MAWVTPSEKNQMDENRIWSKEYLVQLPDKLCLVAKQILMYIVQDWRMGTSPEHH